MSARGPAMDVPSVTARLRAANELADLRPEKRLEGKVSLDAVAVTARLRESSELAELCRSLARAGQRARERRT